MTSFTCYMHNTPSGLNPFSSSSSCLPFHFAFLPLLPNNIRNVFVWQPVISINNFGLPVGKFGFVLLAAWRSANWICCCPALAVTSFRPFWSSNANELCIFRLHFLFSLFQSLNELRWRTGRATNKSASSLIVTWHYGRLFFVRRRLDNFIKLQSRQSVYFCHLIT